MHMSTPQPDLPDATEKLKSLRQTFTAHLVPQSCGRAVCPCMLVRTCGERDPIAGRVSSASHRSVAALR